MSKVSKLETRQISKTYRGRRVVDDVSVFVQQGEVVGLLGPNGAGKTTSFYMIVGLVSPDSGQRSGGRQGHHRSADVPACAPRHQLPAAGGERLPQADGGGESAGDSGDAADARARAARNHGAPAGSTGPGDGAPQPRLHALRRRAAARGDCALAGDQPELSAAGRTLQRASTRFRCWSCSASFSI